MGGRISLQASGASQWSIDLLPARWKNVRSDCSAPKASEWKIWTRPCLPSLNRARRGKAGEDDVFDSWRRKTHSGTRIRPRSFHTSPFVRRFQSSFSLITHPHTSRNCGLIGQWKHPHHICFPLVRRDMEKQKELAALEAQVYRFVELLGEQRAATRENVQRKQAQTGAFRTFYIRTS